MYLCVYVTSPLMNGLQVKAGIQEKDSVMSPLTITADNVTSATTTQVTKVTIRYMTHTYLVLPGLGFSHVTLDITNSIQVAADGVNNILS